MNIAFKKVDITPMLPVQLSGYAALQVAYTAHDPIYARTYLLQNGNKEVLLVQMDLAIIDEFMVNIVSEKTGVAKENLIITTTHTHSGPGGTIDTYNGLLVGLDSDLGGALNPEYCNRIALIIKNAYDEMKKELEPCTMKIWRGVIEGVATNRHSPELDCDKDAVIIEWTTPTKKALWTRYSSHATCLHEENLQVSADFPGYAEKEFLNDYDQVAFINGSAGDMSPRFTRRECSFAECERIGKLAASQIKEIMKQDTPVISDIDFDYKQAVFPVPSKKVGTVEEAEAAYAQAKANLEEGKKNGADANQIRYLESLVEGTGNALLSCNTFSKFTEVRVNVSALTLPGVTFVFVPVEIFSCLTNKLKECGFTFVSYTNGFLGYLPDESAYDNEFYEVYCTPYARSSGELLLKNIKEWLVK